jgi:aminoglycoside phosphotransferase (APT) family kinase protein
LLMSDDLSNRLFSEKARDFLAKAFGADDLHVRGATLLQGGISRQTWRVDVGWQTPKSAPVERSLIFRVDPSDSLLESGRQVEYAMYQAFWRVPGVPVPEPLFLVDDPKPLGAPFMVVSWLPGETRQDAILAPEYRESGRRIAARVFEILGSIAAADYRNLNLNGILPVPAPDHAWKVQLDHWQKVIHDRGVVPLPITSGALRLLYRKPPPPPQRLVVVHGDYHFGNWLYTPQDVIAIVDWEMAHLGDPHEDLAWAFLRNWRSGSAPDKIMQFLDPEEAIRIWESTSGLKVDRTALRWYTLFNHIKAQAIWASAVSRFAVSTDAPLAYAIAGWKNFARQEVWMLEEMGGLRQ